MERQKVKQIDDYDQHVFHQFFGYGKVEYCHTFKESEEYARKQDGRLCTRDELQLYLEKKGPLTEECAGWAAVKDHDGFENWVIVGNDYRWVHKGKLGMDHRMVHHHLPSWHNDKHTDISKIGKPFWAGCVVVWTRLPAQTDQPTISHRTFGYGKHEYTHNYNQSQQLADSLGARLCTKHEAKQYLLSKGPLILDCGAWIATQEQNGEKDWMIAGQNGRWVDHEGIGLSHQEIYKHYPSWGDNTKTVIKPFGEAFWGGCVVIYTNLPYDSDISYLKKKFPIFKNSSTNIRHRTFGYGKHEYTHTMKQSIEYAQSQQGSLVSTQELKEYAIKHGPLLDNAGAWAATNDKNWVVVGSNSKWVFHEGLGVDHQSTYKSYPSWGDNTKTVIKPFGEAFWAGCVVVYRIEVKPAINLDSIRYKAWGWGKVEYTHTYQQSEDYAKSQGGRLCTIEELREYLDHHGPLSNDAGAWAAVKEQDGTKDWVVVGDQYRWVHQELIGMTHYQLYHNYPGWANDINFKYKQFNKAFWAGNVVVWTLDHNNPNLIQQASFPNPDASINQSTHLLNPDEEYQCLKQFIDETDR